MQISGSKIERIATNLINRICKISAWNRSADKVRNHIIPIFEKTLSKTLYTNFYISFNNRNQLSNTIDSPSVSSNIEYGAVTNLDQEEKVSSMNTKYSENIRTLREKIANRLGWFPDLWIIPSTTIKGLENKGDFKKIPGNSLTLCYKLNVEARTRKLLGVVLCLSEGDVLKFLRENKGDSSKAFDKIFNDITMLRYIKDDIKKLKEAQNNDNSAYMDTDDEIRNCNENL